MSCNSEVGNSYKKVELLAPAGNLEKLRMALIYGADAVYIGGKEFSLRSVADNFDIDDMKEGIEFAHNMGKKVYLTLNIIAHNDDIEKIADYIDVVKDIGIDAFIIADPGVFMLARERAPHMEIHVSTQAGNTNYLTVKHWQKMGAKRVVLARELSLVEIEEIHSKTNGEIDIEAFVHGAMCISYSGRCLLSTYMTGRDSNKGFCAQSCRWNYHIVEEKRPGEYFPVVEDSRGTYILNSKDLCMLPYIPKLVKSGIRSFKIEGRMKSSYYVATIVLAYRRAIDDFYNSLDSNSGNDNSDNNSDSNSDNNSNNNSNNSYNNNFDEYKFDNSLLDEVLKVSHREYTTGFYFEKPTDNDRIFGTSSYIRNYEFVGVVLEYDKETGMAKIEQRNRVFTGDEIEVVIPGKGYFKQNILYMKNEEGELISEAPHPKMIYYMPMQSEVVVDSILRKKSNVERQRL